MPPITYEQTMPRLDTHVPRYWDIPPPLNRECIRLPEVVDAPVSIDPALAHQATAFDVDNFFPSTPDVDISANRHICTPATYPGLKSMVVILPSHKPITIHPSRGNNHVMVGDVLGAIDAEMNRKSDTIMKAAFGIEPLKNLDGYGRPQCLCLGGWSMMDYLRGHYDMAGLVKSQMGYDIWELKIGV